MYLKFRIIVLLAAFFIMPLVSVAQSSDAVAKRQAELQAELDATNKDIAYWAKVLEGKQKETASIARDIAILNAKIAEAKAIIRAKNIIAQQLGKDRSEKSATINVLSQKMERQKNSLAKLIRKADELE